MFDKVDPELLKILYEIMDRNILNNCEHEWDMFDKVVAKELKLVKYCTKCGRVLKKL